MVHKSSDAYASSGTLLYQSRLFVILNNFFSGLQGLAKLRYVDLSFNSLIGSNIFESLGASIEVIDILSSNMSGAIQDSGKQ